MITADDLLKKVMESKGIIKNIIKSKIFACDDVRRSWVSRYYGGATGLCNEIIQNIILKLLLRLNSIEPDELMKVIYTELKHQIWVNLYCIRHELCESEFGIKFSSFIDSIPDIEYEEVEDNRPKVELNIETAPITESERSVLKYSFFDDMDYDAICAKLNMKRGTVMHYKNTAIDKLRADYYTRYARQ